MAARLRIPRQELEAALRESIRRVDDLRAMPVNGDADRRALLSAFRNWDEFNQRLLDRAFTPVPWHQTSPKSDYTTLKDLEFLAVDELTPEAAPSLGRLADEKVRLLTSLLDLCISLRKTHPLRRLVPARQT